MTTFSSECYEVLRSLKERRNVIISGPPATGKSRLLNEVATAFEQAFTSPTPSSKPILTPGAAIPIPATPPAPAGDPKLTAVLPSPDRNARHVFRTVFHQGSKHRDFLTGIAPNLTTPGAFRVTEGILYRASEHALTANGASLLIIDEINRGPAVQVFGGAIVAIEGEKRLAPDGKKQIGTQYFELLQPETGDLIEYAFPHHLYILAAMNQADVSVEPLDVAFLRRWVPFNLAPRPEILRAFFSLPSVPEPIPAGPERVADVFEVAVQAWEKVNERISLGRGPEFQMGHGILMTVEGSVPSTIDDALAFVASSWRAIRAHLEEVFFGDIRGLAASFNALGDVGAHPYSLEEVFFADEPRQQLKGPATIDAQNVFSLLKAVAR